MGDHTEEMYIQGFSTSLPTDVQWQMLRSLKGFENAEIMRYAYAIEYDCADPTQLYATLEFKDHPGLYGAGQFNGTSGYEEAAAQGLVAGINAALTALGREQSTLSRSGSYIGTLIDDLITKGTNEPYRMMTSRSEFRLLLRQDNADLRLTPIGYACGLISKERYDAFLAKKEAEEIEKARLEATHFGPDAVNPLLESMELDPVRSGVSLADLLRRPGVSYEDLYSLDQNRPCLATEIIKTVETDVKYAGYIKRQEAEVARQAKLEAKKLPADIDYAEVRGLRLEAAQKLNKIRPESIGQASRISGVNPADVSVLLIYLGLK
jgi:tRNA uridine 5-carboxymethylaminomethyl modification enzyme